MTDGFYVARLDRENENHVREVQALSHVDPWFLHKIRDLIRLEDRFEGRTPADDPEFLADLWEAKRNGLGARTMPETRRYSSVCALHTFWLAGRDYAHSRDPYPARIAGPITRADWFVYPAPVAALIAPLSLLPYSIAWGVFGAGQDGLPGLRADGSRGGRRPCGAVPIGGFGSTDTRTTVRGTIAYRHRTDKSPDRGASSSVARQCARPKVVLGRVSRRCYLAGKTQVDPACPDSRGARKRILGSDSTCRQWLCLRQAREE